MNELEKANKMLAEALRILRRSTGLDWESTVKSRVENGIRSETCANCSGLGYTERNDSWSKLCSKDCCSTCGGYGENLIEETA